MGAPVGGKEVAACEFKTPRGLEHSTVGPCICRARLQNLRRIRYIWWKRLAADARPLRRTGLTQGDARPQDLEVTALTRSEAVRTGVTVSTRLAPQLPCVPGDRVQLQQVMLNLIVNAIPAMSGMGEGARELQISIDAVPSEGGVRVGVRDTGPGLSPEGLSRLFEPFYTTKPEGMGMGLSICRSIIEAHGGWLWATPCEPQGALFQFTIPSN